MKQKYMLNAISVVSGEMISGHGEDSYSLKYSNQKGFVGVFDGCGGTGGKRYPAYDDYTGAYLASRVAALSAVDCWNSSSKLVPETLKSSISDRLQDLKKNDTSSSGGGLLKGSLSKKDFPTTASVVSYNFSDEPLCEFLWAGDSRGYILDSLGLSQVTADDVDADVDAFSNIESDARVTNVINADVDYHFNQKSILLSAPAMLIVATDGCFSYFETPMEFEHLILSVLLGSESLADFEKRLNFFLRKQASDDYTFGFVICGFRRYKDIKAYFRPRFKILKERYINKIISARTTDEAIDMGELWKDYKEKYYRYE